MPSRWPTYSFTSWHAALDVVVLKLETILLVEALYVVFSFCDSWLVLWLAFVLSWPLLSSAPSTACPSTAKRSLRVSISLRSSKFSI